MKSLLICTLAVTSTLFISNCISVTQKEPNPRTTTTTTTERSVAVRPNASVVQTQTTRTQ